MATAIAQRMPTMKRTCASSLEMTPPALALAGQDTAPSVQGEVVGTRVAAGRHLGPLHEQVVEQAGSADAEPLRIQPVLPRCLVDQNQVTDGVLGGADAAGGLDADLRACRPGEARPAPGMTHLPR